MNEQKNKPVLFVGKSSFSINSIVLHVTNQHISNMGLKCVSNQIFCTSGYRKWYRMYIFLMSYLIHLPFKTRITNILILNWYILVYITSSLCLLDNRKIEIYYNNKFHIAAINFRLDLDRDIYYMRMHSYKKYNMNTLVIIM